MDIAGAKPQFFVSLLLPFSNWCLPNPQLHRMLKRDHIVYIHIIMLGLTHQVLPIILRHVYTNILAFFASKFQLNCSSSLTPTYFINLEYAIWHTHYLCRKYIVVSLSITAHYLINERVQVIWYNCIAPYRVKLVITVPAVGDIVYWSVFQFNVLCKVPSLYFWVVCFLLILCDFSSQQIWQTGFPWHMPGRDCYAHKMNILSQVDELLSDWINKYEFKCGIYILF